MTNTPRQTIEVDEFIPNSATRIWQALTDSGELGQWFMATDFQPQVGHEFTLDTGQWGDVACTVIEIQPEHLLRYTWKNPPLDTVVTWTLVSEGKGTRVLLEHHGFDLQDPVQLQAYRGMSGGWKSLVLRRLAKQVQG